MDVLRGPHRWKAWYVDTAWLEEQKRSFKSFVSSNDVLTSWFLKDFDYGLMSVNFRGRLCDLDATYAGNYKKGLAFWPEDVTSPPQVREALGSFRARREDTPRWPVRVGVATNWASVYQELRLKSCREVLHLPVLGDIQVNGAMIIFRAQKDKLAVILGKRGRLTTPKTGVAQRIC